MTERAVTKELMYEVLKSIQAQVALVREDVDSIKARMSSVDIRLGLVHQRYGQSVRTLGSS